MSTVSDRSPAPILSVENLSVVRSGTRILSEVCWTAAAGEHWTILGANGSGKTSLLSALTGYLTPTSGTMRLLGEEYGQSNWPELRKRVGIVSSAIRQQMADHEEAAVTVVSGKYAMIDYWGRVKKADREEAVAILRQIGCEYLAQRRWEVLSQGERQRVLIGRALISKPRLLILDEPCAGLDPVGREHFLQFLAHLCAQTDAPTLVLVTHHVEEIIPAFSHLLVLKQGQVLAHGKRDKVLRSEVLSEAFGEPVRLVKRNGRAMLHVESQNDRVFADKT